MKTAMIRKASSDSELCTIARRDVPAMNTTFGQRDEMEHHAEIGGVQRDLVKQVAGTGQSNQGVEQTDPVQTQRNSKPKD